MSADNWSDIEEVPAFLQSNDWEERIGCLSKAQLMLIAEYLELHVAEGTEKHVLLLKTVNTIKASKEKRGNELLDESSLLDKQIQLQEKEVEKLRLQAQIQYQVTRENELERRDRELEQERERERGT